MSAGTVLFRYYGTGASPHGLRQFHNNNERLTGCEAIYAVRRAQDLDIPAAIVTADRSDACRRVLKTRYFPVLNKPVKPNRLRALLTSLLS